MIIPVSSLSPPLAFFSFPHNTSLNSSEVVKFPIENQRNLAHCLLLLRCKNIWEITFILDFFALSRNKWEPNVFSALIVDMNEDKGTDNVCHVSFLVLVLHCQTKNALTPVWLLLSASLSQSTTGDWKCCVQNHILQIHFLE